MSALRRFMARLASSQLRGGTRVAREGYRRAPGTHLGSASGSAPLEESGDEGDTQVNRSGM